LPGDNANHLGIVRERQQQLVFARSSPEDETIKAGNPRRIGETICLPFKIGNQISNSWLEGRNINYSYRHPDLTCAGISNTVFAFIVFTGTTASITITEDMQLSVDAFAVSTHTLVSLTSTHAMQS